MKAKPFLKWAGGKSQLLSRFEELYPKELKIGIIENYYEPFVGSGAVFFDVAQKYKIKNAYLYDTNEVLILTYQALKENVENLLDILSRYQKKYDKFCPEKRKEFYYKERDAHNAQKGDRFIRAARTIFLNKTCYNGLFRVNASGFFNTPAGIYKKPLICDEKNLIAVNNLLQKAEIKKADFSEVERDLKPFSFVYFDPPYRPISKSANFNAYSKDGFDDKEQERLAELFNRLDQKGAKLALSNSDPKNIDPNDHFFDSLYQSFTIKRVPATRMINSNVKKRGKINEIVVTNYEKAK
ncbi:MAG: Dam family site-specific DNA-(adenine-N6)-methyltransferase [Helicobacteraceae bacterium]|nr:Dam family site-specific DNA-(adenine-N6)-methyltransferase [Helicobacteraceae bacterium]